jgi:putative transposase
MADNGDKTHRIPDELWEQIKPLLPPELPKPRGGRPRMDDRKAMEAILYVFRTGFKWSALPRNMGSPATVRRRFQEWREAGVFQRMWRTGILTYDELRALFWHGKPRMEAGKGGRGERE